MATKYSDIISIRPTRLAYNIENEKEGEWENFIPNEQFNSILQKVIRSVYCNDQDAHKSFWIDGTYGTGKSHAAAVIKHLLCDKVEDISNYIDQEYGETRFEDLKVALYDLRVQKKKRLFPVNMYASQHIAHRADLSHELQRAIKNALRDAGIDQFNVRTDFDNYAEHVEESRDIWEPIISKNKELSAYVPNVDELVRKLRDADTSILRLAKQAISQEGLEVRLRSENLCDWFFEVQDKLAEKTDYSGLLVIWDEFTDLIKSNIGPSLLVDLQEITERAMGMENNSYFFFISHPSALDRLDTQERDKTKGRYHYMKYNMEKVSAFKIMSRKFQINDRDEYERIKRDFFDTRADLLDQYSKDSNNIDDTLNDLRNLYPIHPATANLATYYARVVGSSSRSVFEFIGDNAALREFLDSEELFAQNALITADYLWDFILEVFVGDHIHYGAVTERYNSYREYVQRRGPEALAVFKGILLLNALNNVAGDETVTPSEQNIKSLFTGTPYERDIDATLNWLNEQSIVQRAPGGLFSVQFSALPPQEIEAAKTKMREEFRFTSSIVSWRSSERENQINNLIGQCSRPINRKFYSKASNESILQRNIERDYDQGKPWELFLALFFGVNNNEVNELKRIASSASEDPRFENVAFLVFDQPFGDDKYERFIEYMANAQCAAAHSLQDQQNVYENNASAMIRDWMVEVGRQNVSTYVRGVRQDYSATQLKGAIATDLVLKIFRLGAESLETLRKVPDTFWEKMNAKTVARDTLHARTLGDLVERLRGANAPIRLLLQDAVDENLQIRENADIEHHPLLAVNRFIEDRIRNADPMREFNFAEQFEDLIRPPYGLFPSYAGYTMLAYALRQWVGQMYSQDGRPISAQHMNDAVYDAFKVWDSGKNTSKVVFTFETRQAGELRGLLASAFNLGDVNSLTDARWKITREYLREKGYPLWVLKYANDLESNGEILLIEELIPLIDKLNSIVEEKNASRDLTLMDETIDLLKCYNYEFCKLLNSPRVFEEGYRSFLRSQEGLGIQDDEIDVATKYIQGHLQKEVGLWTEDEVSNQLRDWKLQLLIEQERGQERIDETRPIADGSVTPTSYSNESPNPNPSVAHPVFDGGHSTKISQAKASVNSIQRLDYAQSLLCRICDRVGDDVLNLIIEYRGDVPRV